MPEGFSTVTPIMVVKDAAKAIETYVKAFGAKEVYRMPCPKTGKIMHACFQMGTNKIFICDENLEMGSTATTSGFYLYMDDVDAVFKQATQAGLQEKSSVQDMFWGDRTGCVKDSFGNTWTVATHIRDVSPQELEEAIKKMASSKAA
jgi:uncharacterized glyoxalase superfamily protein PhnB